MSSNQQKKTAPKGPPKVQGNQKSSRNSSLKDTTYGGYDEKSFKKLEFPDSIRKRPGMYIGKLGNGKSPDDGIYILAKEAIDNSIDEFQMGYGKTITIELVENGGKQSLKVTDNGRGIPLGILKECASQVHGGAKFDSTVFQKSVGMNGVGIKAVNALSDHFHLSSWRDGKQREVSFERGVLKKDKTIKVSKKDPGFISNSGTRVYFTPDESLFTDYAFGEEYLEKMAFQYSCLNSGLEVVLRTGNNGSTQEKRFKSQRGLLDYLEETIEESSGDKAVLYPPIHIKGEDIDLCMTHGNGYGEEFHSFVNGQNTIQGGTHVASLKEAIVAAIRNYTGKNYDPADIRGSIIAALSIRLQEPVFESQTKTKLGSTHTEPLGKGVPMRNFVGDFVKKELENFLHRNSQTAKALEAKIIANERERKELAGVKDKAREMSKKASLANRKLRDCRIHFDSRNEKKSMSTLFITEGDSASGSITQVRDAELQAVFSLKGKPANCCGKGKKMIYENEELHLLQSALGIEEGIENLRYNNVVIATDADVDGMHIRLLLSTFLLQYYPELIKEGHVHILQTPLFRVRNNKETIYCYNEDEKEKAIKKLGGKPEITRFKGLGEISPNEFKEFIGPRIKLEPLRLAKNSHMENVVKFFMGANTPARQEFLCRNLINDTEA
jgi:topoisomerase-4 subunit B